MRMDDAGPFLSRIGPLLIVDLCSMDGFVPEVHIWLKRFLKL